MTASLRSVEDVINATLVRIGQKHRIGSIYDGSDNAKVCLDTYAQTRDQLLRTQDWGFAYRSVDLELLKQAPAGGYVPPNTWTPDFPPQPWLFEFAYPDDCLRVKAIQQTQIFSGPNFDPQPVNFSINNDNGFTPPKKAILCNVGPTAILNYIGQITNPAEWEADFGEVMIGRLGQDIGVALANLDMAKAAAQMGSQAMAEADNTQG